MSASARGAPGSYRCAFLLFLVGCGLLSGCGYRVVTPTESSPLVAGRTLAIPIASNGTYRAGIEGVLTDALVDEVGRRGVARLVGPEEGDLVLLARVTVYKYAPLAYSTSDRAVAYLASLTVTTVINERRTGKEIWRETFTRNQDFPFNADLALQQNSEEEAIAELCRGIARDMLARFGMVF